MKRRLQNPLKLPLISLFFILGFVAWNPAQSQITVTTTWSHQWTPAGGPNPAGLDTFALPTAPPRFGSVHLVDIDGDGDKDILSGSNRGRVYLGENVGTPTAPHWVLSNAVPTLDTIHLGTNQNTNEIRPTTVDIDADGDQDLFIGSRWNYIGLHKLDDIYFYRNIGSVTNPVFQLDTIPSLQMQQVAEFTGMAFGDLDNDGDFDLVAGGSDSCTYFLNVGDSANPSFVRDYNFFKPWVEPSFLLPTPDLEDFDQDGDLDMYFQNEAGFIRYIPNLGTPTNPDFSPFVSYPAHSFDTLDYGAFGTMCFEDVTGDGVKDLMATHWNPTSWYWSKGENPGPVGVIASQNVSCNGNSDGYAVVTTSSGTPPYTYLWSTGATSDSIGGLSAGAYSVTITDASGFTGSTSVSITQPNVLMANVSVAQQVTCNGAGDGQLGSAPTGGTSPYTYAWSNAATTATVNSLISGTYTVTVTDANGCTGTGSATITEPTALVASAMSTDASCNGCTDGTATASATGGTGSYTYSWSTSGTTAMISSLATGTYTVTVTDANGCTDVATTVVSSGPNAAVNIDSTVSCFGFSNGGASATVTGGTTPYTYLWSTAATSASITGLTSGTYTVTVTDASGLTSTSSAFISQPSAVAATATTNNNATCNGTATGNVTGSASGGTGSYTYAWSNGVTTAANSGVMAGTYTVTVTDANGCTDVNSTSVTEPVAIVANSTVNGNVSCHGLSDGSAMASATGGTGTYTYLWSTGATTSSATMLAAGTYTATITDANGCTATASSTITEPTALAASASVTNHVSCNGLADGVATVSATGGTGAYTYLWSNAATTATNSSLAAGTYTVTVTDANGCTSTGSAVISEPAVLMASTAVDSNVSCNGFSDGGMTASVTGGTGPYTYSWNNAATSASITGVMAATYTVTITDANGCTATSFMSISEPTLLVASSTVNNDVSCNGGSDGAATASVTGGTTPYTYNWSSGSTTSGISGMMAGTYTVTVTDFNGCTSSSSVTIVEPVALMAAATANNNVSCNGLSDGEATVSVTGGTTAYTYTWSNAATTATISGLAAGTYTVTVTDANGCTSTSSVTITEPAVLTASSMVDNQVSCNGFTDGGATASATGGTTAYTYLWSNAATTASITGVGAGTYTVTVTDANGCTSTSSLMITEPTILVAASTVNANVTCNGFADGGATASATGGTSPYTYIWSNSATTAAITGVTAGTYTVTVTDANGCTSTSSSTVTEPTLLVSSAAVDQNVSCNGLSDGAATASATGGTGAYTYLWSNSATTASITGLAAGTYSVTVTDANGCTDSTSIAVSEPMPLVATAAVDSNVSCNGFSDGGASSAVSGGTMPYTYLWSNGDMTSSTSMLAAGTYTLTIADANGCTSTGMVTIVEPTVLTVTTVVDSNVTCSGLANGGASAQANGGTMPYTYSWSNGATTSSTSSLAAGTYQLTVLDSNGCMVTDSVAITQPDLLVASIDSIHNVICLGDSNGAAFGSATGGTMPYAYSWSNGDATTNAINLMEGPITFTVTDSNGCQSSVTDTVDHTYELPVIDLGPDTSVTVSAVVLNLPNTFSFYQWSTGSTDTTVTIGSNGPVWVVVTDSNGCSNSDTINVSLWPDGIQTLEQALQLKVYPNPSRGLISIETPGFEEEALEWKVFSLNGRLVKNGRFVSGAADLRGQIDLRDEAGGIYLLQVATDEVSTTVRLIIQ